MATTCDCSVDRLPEPLNVCQPVVVQKWQQKQIEKEMARRNCPSQTKSEFDRITEMLIKKAKRKIL